MTSEKTKAIQAIVAAVMLFSFGLGCILGYGLGHNQGCEVMDEKILNYEKCLEECTWQAQYTYARWQVLECESRGDTTQAQKHIEAATRLLEKELMED